ncbi:hypothetical protein BT69DRAFT_1284512 [Atractiella rhizophila]|nr:hypothetical protein BT69DRAFT_1284512 [Atractiella rhizophila]
MIRLIKYDDLVQEPSDIKMLDASVQFSSQIFPLSFPEGDRYGDYGFWKDTLDRHAGMLYVSILSYDDPIRGIMFVKRKPLSSILPSSHPLHSLPMTESWHIWIAAVSPEERGKGLLSELFQTFINTLEDEDSTHISALSVRTIPSIFQNMVHWLNKEWEIRGKARKWERVETERPTGKEDEKVAFIMNLQ